MGPRKGLCCGAQLVGFLLSSLVHAGLAHIVPFSQFAIPNFLGDGDALKLLLCSVGLSPDATHGDRTDRVRLGEWVEMWRTSDISEVKKANTQ